MWAIVLQRGKISRSNRRVSPAIELNSRLTPAYGYLAKALIQQNQLKEAEEAARAGTQVDPNYSENWRQLGRALELSGRLPEAAEAYSKMNKFFNSFSQSIRSLQRRSDGQQ